MGNFPLCIPKPEGIVFRDYPANSSDFVLHHQFQASDVNEQGPTEQGENDGCTNNDEVVDDAAVLGIEIDQDSVCKSLLLPILHCSWVAV